MFPRLSLIKYTHTYIYNKLRTDKLNFQLKRNSMWHMLYLYFLNISVIIARVSDYLYVRRDQKVSQVFTKKIGVILVLSRPELKQHIQQS